MLSLRSSVCPPPHSSHCFSLSPGGRWQSKTDGRSLRQYFLPPVNGYEAQVTRALLHRKVRSITQPSPLGKVDCEARRMRLRCANNPSASLRSAPPFAQGRRKPHPPQAVPLSRLRARAPRGLPSHRFAELPRSGSLVLHSSFFITSLFARITSPHTSFTFTIV